VPGSRTPTVGRLPAALPPGPAQDVPGECGSARWACVTPSVIWATMALVLGVLTTLGCVPSRPQKVEVGPYVFDLTADDTGWYVLRWQEPLGRADQRGIDWQWSCYVVDDPQGRTEVLRWVQAHAKALYWPRAERPLRMTPVMQLAWFYGGGLGEGWDLWPHRPAGPPSWPVRSRLDLLTGPWVENLPVQEFERLKRIFRQYGRSEDPNRPDLCEALGSTRPAPASILHGGTFVLQIHRSDADGNWTTDSTFAAIDSEPARKEVENWVAANYEALKCGQIETRATVLPDRRLWWFNEDTWVCMELAESIPVGRGDRPEYMERVANLPEGEFERLRRIFDQHGKTFPFDPASIQRPRQGVSLVE